MLKKQFSPHLAIATILLGVLGINSISLPAFSQINPPNYTNCNNHITVPNNTSTGILNNGSITTIVGSANPRNDQSANQSGYYVTPNGNVITPNGFVIRGDGREILSSTGSVYSSGGFRANPDGSFVTSTGTLITPEGGSIYTNASRTSNLNGVHMCSTY
jgi:hypothetical protein